MICNVISNIIGIIGVVLTIGSIIYNIKEAKKRRSITWTDINAAANNLAKDLKKKYKPDVICYIYTQYKKWYFSPIY
ncbi:hypothetical protein [Eubacterium sp. LMAG:50]|uniref:hypothetical protein n=1 Tax=Eubacterium sp. LMAG:50 TaxID=1969563 RepID=UPI0025C1316C|nr:hypothetical protein [Eubacterium sp. LMAG:50]